MHGIYALIIQVENTTIRVGSLGMIHFDGIYAYIGSALNSLEYRIRRHLSKSKKIHWHIDSLTVSDKTSVKYVVYAKSYSKHYECIISKNIADVSIGYVRGFGSSDCKCLSHLYLLHKSDLYYAVKLVNDAFILCKIKHSQYDFNI